MEIQILDAGDTGLLVCFEQVIQLEINQRVRTLAKALQQTSAYAEQKILACIPSYCALLIIYEPLVIERAMVIQMIQAHLNQPQSELEQGRRLITIPVDYSEAVGLDQERVCQYHGISQTELILMHTAEVYDVYMLGFLAGFPYLGGMNPDLATPRLEQPRIKLEAGAVGIAGPQTGIYSVNSPGGWNIIGRTTVKLFDPHAAEPFLLSPGDRLRFINDATAPVQILGTREAFPKQTDDSKETVEAFRVIEAGFGASVQDLGRMGYQAYGISNSGVMDWEIQWTLNRLLNQEVTLPVLEWAILGPALEVITPCSVAMGADMIDAKINEGPIEPWCVYALQKGDIIKLGNIRNGIRGFLGMSGGFAGELLLGSRSVDIQSGLGQVLKQGTTILGLKDTGQVPSVPTKGAKVSPPPAFQYVMDQQLKNEAITLRVLMGPQATHFTTMGLETFLNSSYEVSHQANRMGIRLMGESIALVDTADIISEGINQGAIQVNGSGQPMIMLADRQTIGGYAKIAHVIMADLPKLAHLKPGMNVRFEAVAVEAAHRQLRLSKVNLEENYSKSYILKNSDCLAFKDYVVKLNGKSYQVSLAALEDNSEQ